MGRGTGVLQLAVLGLLHESPMHGYELRKRLNVMLGWGRAFSYGSLYPCLKTLLGKGWITEEAPAEIGLSRRARIVYSITALGREHFRELIDEVDEGGSLADDETFGVRFAFFSRTDRSVRLRILESRKRRLEDRLERVRTQLQRTQERLDNYAVELQMHGLESVEREVRWLTELIAREQQHKNG